MAYIVTEPCIGVKDHACVDVCPVDCFYEGFDQVFIHLEECIDCGACIPACPVSAIYEGNAVPPQYAQYVTKAEVAFRDDSSMPRSPKRAAWEAEKAKAEKS
ncbi:MAG: indolepyruvate ferredoxin oxidoreductase subunit alpha [Dongiaceae bacterium]